MDTKLRHKHEILGDASEFAKKATDGGFDVLVAIRNSEGTLQTVERRIDDNSNPICHRFTEVASCRTKLIDIALLLRDCFTEILMAKQQTK